MRAVSFVDRLEFDFKGNVLRNAVVLGDVDNDGQNELVVGSEAGEIAVFKGSERAHTLSDLNFITCLAIGDLMNVGRNCLVVVTGDGWCYVYCFDAVDSVVVSLESSGKSTEQSDASGTKIPSVFAGTAGERSSGKSAPVTPNPGLVTPVNVSGSTPNVSRSIPVSIPLVEKKLFRCIHTQRIPANSKDILLEDIDGDGKIELVLALTDRIVRSYRWYDDLDHDNFFSRVSSHKFERVSGKLVCLNKWECAKQIGSITLHHYENSPCLLVAQPGGTFMRIVCTPEDNIDASSHLHESQSSSDHSDSMVGSKITYEVLNSSHMRNLSISTEILGNIRSSSPNADAGSDGNDLGKPPEEADANFIEEAIEATSSTFGSAHSVTELTPQNDSSYVVTTLDGTIMLVRDETILWSIAVDRQVFAVSKLDVTGNGIDDIVACCWDGQTYILDQSKNSVRFHFSEAVQAFQCGHYGLEDCKVTCFVYVTFRNKIYLYYDIPLKEIVCRRFEPDMSELKKVLVDENAELSRQERRELVEYLLYGVKD